jgi:hypothetical protein
MCVTLPSPQEAELNYTIIATLVGATCLLLAPMATLARGRPMTGFAETLTVKSSKGRVLVDVLFDNQSAHAVHVPRALATEKELFGRLFEVRDASTGEPVEYQGIMVKRGPLAAADFLTIKPRARHRNTIDITDSYAFKQGRHTYQLAYQGSYLTDLAKPDQALPLAVAPVTFTHSAK